MFNKSNHKVEYFSKELETKKKKFQMKIQEQKKKLTYSMRPLPQGSLYTENNTGERTGNAEFQTFPICFTRTA